MVVLILCQKLLHKNQKKTATQERKGTSPCKARLILRGDEKKIPS